MIVLWTLSDDGYWETSQLMLSQHMGYQTLDWEDIQNTLDTEDAPLERGGDDGRTNLDHAKVYVAWSKHAHYNTRNTDFRSPWTQLFSIAFRSDDWWYFPVSGKLSAVIYCAYNCSRLTRLFRVTNLNLPVVHMRLVLSRFVSSHLGIFVPLTFRRLHPLG